MPAIESSRRASSSGDRGLVVASNRGPVSYSFDPSGDLSATRGAGGLVSSLGPLLRGSDATWIAAAMTEADRRAAGSGVVETKGFNYRSLDIEPHLYRQYYDVISNSTLWFLHHGLSDSPRRPRYDRRWHQAWQGYRSVNRTFAEAIAEETPEGGVVLVQDYHLALVGRWLGELRPDLDVVHFNHTPFCDPVALRSLPDAAADEMLEALAGYRACGFHSRRWADRFTACCKERLGQAPATFVSAIAPDVADLEGVAAGEDCARAATELEARLDGRRLILRVDRIELSKNLLRGFWAYDEMLECHPEWRGRVVFAALGYPSRETLAEYRAYRHEVATLARAVNQRWSTDDWQPVIFDPADNFASSVAALVRYDVLLVNPVRDGLNLVAKEGAILNRNDGVVVLSTEAGVHDELGDAAVGVNPFDVTRTAEAMADALAMDPAERAKRSGQLRSLSLARTPGDWLSDQLAAARGRRS